jgi:eukaryotic-like serine/threonine-protein kinase
MNREQWEAAVALFERTRVLPRVARQRMLDEISADDPALAQRVREMLHADAATHPLLDAERHELARLVAEADPVPGPSVGPYDVIREIGRGGMGAVYLARRRDVDKQVALKLVTGGIASAGRVERFLHERRVLAQLEHPHIARLMDAGVMPDGTPWLAMEYVDGEAVDVWCDARRLDIGRRIELFVRVCDAVAYAHRNLVVHRDLKPANILITASGEPRLVDFGIARLLDTESGAAPVTRGSAGPLTPEYASPEQLLGAPITTASDVYQLGALLCELLTGVQPRRAHATPDSGHGGPEDEPPRPSQLVARMRQAQVAAVRATTTAALVGALSGDLDNIVSLAMRPDPNARYASAQQLADDLRRYRDGRPVVARAQTAGYRAVKFVRRNRVAVAAAVMVFATLLGASATTAWQARRATAQAAVAAAERDRANAEAARAESVAEFLTELFQAADPEQSLGRNVTAREVLARGAERLEVDGDLNAQPLVLAALLDVLGRVYRSIGAYDDARPLLERALALRREHLPPAHADIAESLAALGVLAGYQGRSAEARTRFEEALAIWRAAEPIDSAKLATGAHNLASVHMMNASLDTAEALLRQAAAIRRGLGDGAAAPLAENLDGLAIVLSRSGRLEAADSFNLQALGLRRRLLEAGHPQIAVSLTGLGVNALRRGDAAAAEPYLREALEIRRAVYGAHNLVAGSLNNLGSSLERQGRLGEAEAAYRESLAMRQALVPGDHRDVALSLNNLGLLLMERGELNEAEPLLRESWPCAVVSCPTATPTSPAPPTTSPRCTTAAATTPAPPRSTTRRSTSGGTASARATRSLCSRRSPSPNSDAAAMTGGARELASWVVEIGAAALPPDDSLLLRARRILGSRHY